VRNSREAHFRNVIETSEELPDQTRQILLDNLAGAGVLDHLVRPPSVNQNKCTRMKALYRKELRCSNIVNEMERTVSEANRLHDHDTGSRLLQLQWTALPARTSLLKQFATTMRANPAFSEA
jgi:hypothetical protein